MTTYKLTADELLLVYLTFLARDEEGHPEYFNQWFRNGGKARLRGLFNSLKEKGFIHKDYNPEIYVPNEIEFNKNFLKTWIRNSMELGRELFNEYPPFICIDKRYIPLKDISKRFSSLDDFFFFYSVQIGHDIKRHEEVMEIMRWAKKNHYLNFGILNFVVSNQWKALKELKENPEAIEIADNICIDE